MSYVEDVIQDVIQKNPNEPEFTSAVSDLLQAVVKPVRLNSRYEQMSIIERMTEPEKVIIFQVPWVDDQGIVQVNRGYRVQFNSALGPCKGGIQFGPEINLSKVKSYAFEQMFKNALTGLPIGGSNGGADFNPKGKSETEIMRFCQSYMTELYHYLGPDRDIPDTGQGVSEREIGYMFGQYKRMANANRGAIAGKSGSYGGTALRNQGSGYGLVYFLEQYLASKDDKLEGKTIAISGSGNTANSVAEKAMSKGATVITLSDDTGWLYDPNGIDVEFSKKVRRERVYKLRDYVETHPGSKYNREGTPWEVAHDITIPCAGRGEVTPAEIPAIVASGSKLVVEGFDMATGGEAFVALRKEGIVVLPSKATTAGGAAVKVLELSQNDEHMSWTEEKVDATLQDIMKGVFKSCDDAAKAYGYDGNFMIGSVIAAFLKVADAMLAEGV